MRDARALSGRRPGRHSANASASGGQRNMVEQENLTAERQDTFRAAAILRASSKQEVGR